MWLSTLAAAFDVEAGLGLQHALSESAAITGATAVVRAVPGVWSVEAGGFVGFGAREPSGLDKTLAVIVLDAGGDAAVLTSGDLWGAHAAVGLGDAARVPRRLTGCPIALLGVDVRGVYHASLVAAGDTFVTKDEAVGVDGGPYLGLGVGVAWGEHLGLRIVLDEHLRPDPAVPSHRLTTRSDLSADLLYRF